jgi:signal transduction histidine kinase
MDALSRTLIANAGDPTWVMTRDFAITDFNAPFAALCEKVAGVKPVAPVALDALARDPEANAWWRDVCARVFAGRNITADRRPVIDGTKRYFLISGMPVIYEDDVVQAVFTARDVTGTRHGDAEELFDLAVTRILTEAKPLESVLADLLEFVCESDGWDCGVIWLVDSNEEPEQQRLAPSVIWSRPDPDAVHFRERMSELRFARGRGIPGKAWARGETYSVADLMEESTFLRKEINALSGLHAAAAVPLHDSERVVGVLEMMTRAVRPLSERRQQALGRAGKTLGRLIVRRQLQQIVEKKSYEWTQTFDAIGLPIFITHLDGTIARVNRAARDLVGGEFKDVLGRNIAVGRREPWKTLGDCVTSVSDSRSPCTAQIAESDRHWDVNATWYHSTFDGEDRVILMMRDTTDLVHLAESVRRGEKLAALGELVGGVAHEVRNPIFGIGITIDAMQQLIPDTPELNELFDILRRWLARLNRLMENLLAYGKSWTLSLEEGSLNGVLDGVLDECRQIAAQSSVQVEADIEPDLVLLMDSHRLGHAFENIIINAIQHSSLRQTVHVTARRENDGIGESIVFSARDHGPGFNPAELPRIFEPFFTKRRGGTGLGLSIAQRVVDEHGGIITASNAEDGGAVVTARFPLFLRGRENGQSPYVE